jgi:hypothetical protein
MVVNAEPNIQLASGEGCLDRFSSTDQIALLRGEIIVTPLVSTGGGGAVPAHMFVPLDRGLIWSQLTNYRRWTQFFPNISHSEVLETVRTGSQRYRRLYQVGCKGFMKLTAKVEIYLKVFENACDSLQFRFEQGTFSHFAADLELKDLPNGTLLTYGVQANPTIPVPSFLIEQGMKLDLPGNMKQMRQVLCAGYAKS